MDYLQYFNKLIAFLSSSISLVLNLIINGLPSILYKNPITVSVHRVLNLIINGLPSIPPLSWAPKYLPSLVLNLIINGLPSILSEDGRIRG